MPPQDTNQTPVDPNAPVVPAADPNVPAQALVMPPPAEPEPQAPVEQPATPTVPAEGTGDAGTGTPPVAPPAA